MDKAFIDSNIWIYAFISVDNLNKNDLTKHDICIQLLEQLHQNQTIILSTQVINEVHWTLIRKYKFTDKNAKSKIDKGILAISKLVTINKKTYDKAFQLRKQNHFSFWDSLIIASSIENKSNILYSEDMQHEQLIEEQLKITNPFISNLS